MILWELSSLTAWGRSKVGPSLLYVSQGARRMGTLHKSWMRAADSIAQASPIGGSVSGYQGSRRAPTPWPAPGAWAWLWTSLWVKFHWPAPLRIPRKSPKEWDWESISLMLWLWCHLAQLQRAAVTWGTVGGAPERSQLPNIHREVFLGGCSYQGPSGRFQKVFLKVVTQEIAYSSLTLKIHTHVHIHMRTCTHTHTYVYVHQIHTYMCTTRMHRHIQKIQPIKFLVYSPMCKSSLLAFCTISALSSCAFSITSQDGSAPCGSQRSHSGWAAPWRLTMVCLRVNGTLRKVNNTSCHPTDVFWLCFVLRAYTCPHVSTLLEDASTFEHFFLWERIYQLLQGCEILQHF